MVNPPPEKTKRVPTHHPNPNPLARLSDNEYLLERIFSFLPLKDAVHASAVSTRYKQSWLLSRHLWFDENLALQITSNELIQLVDRVLNSHEGPHIQSFCLYINPLGVESLIQEWLRICIQKKVEDIEISFLQPGFTFPFHMLDIQTMKSLKLTLGEIKVPPILKGLQFLHTIVLTRVDVTEDELKTLVCHCKMLGRLELIQNLKIHQVTISANCHKHFKVLKIGGCTKLTKVDIDAPSLRTIFYSGVQPTIRFAQFLPLEEAFFDFLPSKKGYYSSQNLEILARNLHYVKLLTISVQFPEALTTRFRDGKFQEALYEFRNLRELQLFMQGGLCCNVYDIAALLKNCPVLEKLFIDMNDFHFECGLYWELHHKKKMETFNHYFHRLRFVKLSGIKFSDPELQLLKILLQKAINLEYLIFITPKNNRAKLHKPLDLQECSRRLNSWKASPRARIGLFDHKHDGSIIYPTHGRCWY